MAKSANAVVINNRSAEALAKITKLHKSQLRDLAEEMTEVSKDKCPVDTGNLRDSIDWAERSIGLKLIVEVFTQTNYGAYPELGTSRQAAQPYLAPGFREAFHTIVERGGKLES